jgi:hypothetical protein
MSLWVDLFTVSSRNRHFYWVSSSIRARHALRLAVAFRGGCMHLLMNIARMSLLIVLLVSCGPSSATNFPSPLPPPTATLPSPTVIIVSTPTPTLAKPGDSLGDVTLVTMVPAPTQMVDGITDGCPQNEVNKPGVYTFTCSAHATPVAWLGIGWSNTSANIVWQAIGLTCAGEPISMAMNSISTASGHLILR